MFLATITIAEQHSSAAASAGTYISHPFLARPRPLSATNRTG